MVYNNTGIDKLQYGCISNGSLHVLDSDVAVMVGLTDWENEYVQSLTTYK